MKPTIIIFIAIVFMLSCKNEISKEQKNSSNTSREISFYTPDSIRIFGDLYELNKKANTILLFHQGGSNARGEYAPIIPRLIERGFNVLAIDQRMGGQVYGSFNRTLANIPTNSFGDGYGYCDAFNNLEGALNFITKSGFMGKKILWGSSYSASLVIQLADKRQSDVNGVLAFSPASGRSMKDCLPNGYFATLSVPLLILRPPSEMENENVKAQLELAKTNGHQTHVGKHGVHGSSMLVDERVGNDVEDTWRAVLIFLDGI